MRHPQSLLWVMDAYFSKTYLREIFVSLTLQKMMSNESVLCSVRPNRKIFQEKINDTISVLKIYLRLVFPFIRCFKTYSKNAMHHYYWG